MSDALSLTVTDALPETARRIDKIARSLTGLSVRQAQGLFDAGGVKLNGAVCREPWKWLVIGDVVEVEHEPGRYYQAEKKPRKFGGFDVVFEDEYLLVVNKHAGVLTVPTEARETNTLVHRVSDYLARGKRTRPQVWVAHRLDRGVSGLLVLGKQPEIATALREQLAEHKPLRRYLAIVAGSFEPDETTLDNYLATNDFLTRIVTDDAAQGERAITHLRMIERLPNASLVDVRLETGRRHQIRVHLTHVGHPVLGDERYGGKRAKHSLWTYPRLALAAVELGFVHPVTSAEQRFKLPMPPELASFLARLQRGTQ